MIKDKVDPTEKSLLRVIGPTRRLRIGLSTSLPDGTSQTGFMTIPPRVLQEGGISSSEAASMDRELAWAQAASMESELYEEVTICVTSSWSPQLMALFCPHRSNERL